MECVRVGCDSVAVLDRWGGGGLRAGGFGEGRGAGGGGGGLSGVDGVAVF